MNIYLLEQNVNDDYDTYDSMVVCAPDEESAKQIHPYLGSTLTINATDHWEEDHRYPGAAVWANSPDQVQVTLLGTSNNPTQKIILASYNAG